MKIAYILLWGSIIFSQLSFADDLKSKIRNDVRVVKEIHLNAHESAQFEIPANSDLWVGFNFEFPQNSVADHKGMYVFEIKDETGYAGVSSGRSR